MIRTTLKIGNQYFNQLNGQCLQRAHWRRPGANILDCPGGAAMLVWKLRRQLEIFQGVATLVVDYSGNRDICWKIQGRAFSSSEHFGWSLTYIEYSWRRFKRTDVGWEYWRRQGRRDRDLRQREWIIGLGPMSFSDIWSWHMSVQYIWVGIDVSLVHQCPWLESWGGNVLFK